MPPRRTELTPTGKPGWNGGERTKMKAWAVSACLRGFTEYVKAPPAHLSLRILVDSPRVVTGSTIRGRLVVDNPGAPLNLTATAPNGCEPGFQIYLTNRTIDNESGFDAICNGAPFIISSGTDKFPFKTLTTYSSCSPPGDSLDASAPTCPASGGMPPLPPGTYRATIAWSEPVPLPTPRPVTVTVVAGST
jgi:hypothetical protein